MALRNIVIFFLLCVLITMVQCRDIRLRERQADQAEPGSPQLIDIASIQRIPVEHGQNKFTVRYTKNRPDIKVEVFDFSSPIPQSATEGQGSGGVTTFTFTLNVTEEHGVALQASALDRTFSQIYVLENNAGPKTQSTFGTLDFEIIPDGNIEYSPGTNAQFTVVLNEHTGEINQWANPRIAFHVLDITSQQFKNIYDFESLTEMTKSVLPSGANQTQVTVLTAERPITGMVEVTFSNDGQKGDLVTGMTVTRARVLKPSTLEDVFPPSYVGFIEKVPQHCSIGKDCILNCVAVGNSVSTIRVTEIGLKGISSVSSVTEPEDSFPYTRMLVWHADANSPSSAGYTRKFRCDARGSGSHWTSQEIDVQYTMNSVIDETRSNVTVEADGNITRATLTCAVKGGYPQPNMTFNLEYQYAHYYGQSPDVVIPRGGNEFLMLKVVTFDPNEGHGGYYHAPTGRLMSASCETYQGMVYHYNTYNLPFIERTPQAV